MSPHTSTATGEVDVTEEPSEEFPCLKAAVQAPTNGSETFAMAMKRKLPVTKLNDSDKSKLTTLREQVRSYRPKLRTIEVVPLYFRISRGPIGALGRSLGTVLSRGSMMYLTFIGRESLEMPCPFFCCRNRRERGRREIAGEFDQFTSTI